jgi:phospholipid N-methyltransferase
VASRKPETVIILIEYNPDFYKILQENTAMFKIVLAVYESARTGREVRLPSKEKAEA